MPKRSSAGAKGVSISGGKKAKPSVEDELAAVRSAIVKAIGEMDFATVAVLERQETELKQLLAKAAYETAKAANDKIQKPGAKKDAAKSAMDQAHAVYLALLGACLCQGRN